jgi:hypothetical protein
MRLARHGALGLGGRDLQLLADRVQRDDRPASAVLADPGVLACAGQSGHQHDLERGVVVGGVGGVGLGIAEVEETAVVGGEGARARVALHLFAEGAEQGDAIEQLGSVGGLPASNVRLGQQRHPIQPHALARFDRGALGVWLVEKAERQTVVPDQLRNCLPGVQRNRRPEALASPERVAGERRSHARVPARSDPAVRLNPRAARLADIVEQRGGEHLGALCFRQAAPFLQPDQRLGDQAGVDQHVALSMKDGILCDTGQRANQGESPLDRLPVQAPRQRGWTERPRPPLHRH